MDEKQMQKELQEIQDITAKIAKIDDKIAILEEMKARIKDQD